MATHRTTRVSDSQIIALQDEVVRMLTASFGEKLCSIYLIGSYAQGVALNGSDADFIVTLSAKPSTHMLATYNEGLELLNARWCPSPIYKMDLDLILDPFVQDNITIRSRFLIQLTGRLLYGKPVYDDVISEYSPAMIAAAFREFHFTYMPTIPINDPDSLIRTAGRRAKAKYLLRELEWIAVLAGAPLSCVTSEFVDHIKKYTPEHTQLAEFCWGLYRKPYVNDTELAELQRRERYIVTQFDTRVNQALAGPGGTVPRDPKLITKTHLSSSLDHAVSEESLTA